MSHTPSKAEIEALAQQHLKAFAQFTGAGEVWFEGEVEFARAVLAKWGTPQPAPAPLSAHTASRRREAAMLSELDMMNLWAKQLRGYKSQWERLFGFGYAVEAEVRKQNFGQVRNAFIRIVNQDTNSEVARYDLAEDASTETAMIFAELYRNGSEWKFRAVGQGFNGGLKPLAESYGLKF